MSSEWPRTTFDQLCDIKRGASPRPIHDWLSPTGIPWVKISDATASSSPFISKTAEFIRSEGVKKSVEVFPGDFILSNSATPGIPKFMQIHACVHDGWLLLRNFRGLDQWYCYYLLKTERENLIRQGNGSVFTNLKTEILKRHEVGIPPLEYQREVAAFLRSLDDRITLLRETNGTLEAIAQALFKSWFVDFDPVRAKMEGRAPEGMDEATAALFPDSFEETELGAVPRGWRLLPLAEAFEINPTRKLKKGELAPYLDMASVGTQGHVADAAVLRDMGSGSKFVNGDTLLARITPCLENGKTAFVDFLSEAQIGWGSTEFVVLRPRAPLPDYFAYLLCRHVDFREFAIQSMSGTSGRQRIQNDVLGRYPVAVPTIQIAAAFGQIVSTLQQRIAANHASSQTLATLRDTLLPRLISGQLRLSEAQTKRETT